jgi:hypothetical protein
MQLACQVRKAQIQAHNQNTEYLLLFHGINGYANMPQCYGMCHFPILLKFLYGHV